MRLSIRVPGSCGELVQGVAQGKPFLGTCPIDRYTTVQVSDAFTTITGLGDKARQALRLTLQQLGQTEFPFGLQLESELPPGKGMASSSADIAAVVVAVMEALHKPWSPEFIMRIATQIEPTDGVFCPGIVLMDHVSGQLLASFSAVPALRAAIFDMGGTVDTCAFHQQARSAQDKDGLLTAFQQAMYQGQAELVAKAATESAFGNQDILYKEELAQIWQLGQEAGAWGVNAAHSGTVLGLWWSADTAPEQIDAWAEKIAQTVGIQYIGQARLRSGGVEVRT